MLNRNIYLKYIKLFEHFEKKIPDSLKEIFSKIRSIIGNRTDSFEKSISLREMGLCDINVNIVVKFDKIQEPGPYENHDIIYYSNINIYDLIGTDIKEINMPIYIKDVFIITDKLISIISHEIRHIYDVYNTNNEDFEVDMMSFVKSCYYNILKTHEDNNEYKKFLYLVYLSLEHELIARNTMIWEMFINCHCSKEKLYKLFEESNIYESFNLLDNFNYNAILKIDNLIDKVNYFIGYFGGDLCKNQNDVILFFEKWDLYFKNKSDEYKKEGYMILDDIFKLIKENVNNNKKKNVKEMLMFIHQNYIFNN